LFPGRGSRDEYTQSDTFHAEIYKSLSKDHLFALCEVLFDLKEDTNQPFINYFIQKLLDDHETSPDNTPAQSTLMQKIRSKPENEQGQ